MNIFFKYQVYRDGKKVAEFELPDLDAAFPPGTVLPTDDLVVTQGNQTMTYFRAIPDAISIKAGDCFTDPASE